MIQIRIPPAVPAYSGLNTSGGEEINMYLDDAVVFGLVTVAMMIAFMGGWIAFIVRDHRKKR